METELRIQESPELRVEGDQNPKLIGYAALYDSKSNDLGGFVEIIRKGAFDASLASNPDVAARVQHQGGLMTIGRTTNGTLKLSADKKGLRYEVTPPNTSAGRDIVELVRGGYINKSSFAFSLRGNGGDRWNFETNPPLRELLSVNLHDVAPVDGPAYDNTSVAVRSMEMAKKLPEANPIGLAKDEPVEKPIGLATDEERSVDLGGFLKDQYNFLRTFKPAK